MNLGGIFGILALADRSLAMTIMLFSCRKSLDGPQH